MKKQLDLRTMLVALLIFGLGFATCFVALGGPTVMADDPSGEITLDRLFVRDYIEFLDNGVKLIASDEALACSGPLEIDTILRFADGPEMYGDAGILAIAGDVWTNTVRVAALHIRDNGGANEVIDSGRNLKMVTIDPNVVGGSGLNVGKFGGYSTEEFVLKSEIGPEFCEVFCPIVLKKW